MNALRDELLAVLARGVDAILPDAEFNRLALEVFAYQFARNRPYGAYCRARSRAPDTVSHWREVPALPTAAFKEAELTTVPTDEVRVVYQTSGTMRGTEKRGRHLLPDTLLYDAALEPNFRAHLLPDVEGMRILVFGPTARHFPQSSLGHMHTRVLERFGAAGSGIFWSDGGPRFGCLAAALEKAEREGTPVCLLGTAFGWVHFLDRLADEGRMFRLPEASRLMDTGGYKGRSREVPKDELYALYGARLGIPLRHVVNEYGMTELSSQFYDQGLRDYAARGETAALARRKVPPPWVHTEVVHPETLAPLPEGETGLLRHFDLANLHTVAAVQTDDLGVQRGDGFEVLGRAAGAEPRGCSLAAEELVAGGE
ncbi:MAG TPA: hypothetical protein VK689_16140 [Armatimonadota bacterium]|nr:hypothetical protein [Armatimonadota bacterium]